MGGIYGRRFPQYIFYIPGANLSPKGSTEYHYCEIDRSTDIHRIQNQNATMDQTIHPTASDAGLESSYSRGTHLPTSPSRPGNINLKDTEVDASWQCHRLFGYLSLFWDGASRASLRLQVSINILPEKSRPTKTSLHLFISPERISRILVTEPIESLRTLEFTLSSPPFLVLPDRCFEPRDDVSKKTMDLLYGLASQMNFSLHLNIPDGILSPENLRRFCVAASGGRLPKANQEAERTRLYRGNKIVEGETLAGLALHPASLEAPAPEYSESTPAPGSAPAYRSVVSSSTSGE